MPNGQTKFRRVTQRWYERTQRMCPSPPLYMECQTSLRSALTGGASRKSSWVLTFRQFDKHARDLGFSKAAGLFAQLGGGDEAHTKSHLLRAAHEHAGARLNGLHEYR